MEKEKIRINDKVYLVEIAVTDDEKEKGLSNREQLNENSGMLFL